MKLVQNGTITATSSSRWARGGWRAMKYASEKPSTAQIAVAPDRQEDAPQQAVQVQRRGERAVVLRRPAEEDVERDRVDRAERVHRDQRERRDEEDHRQDGGRHHQQVPARQLAGASPSRGACVARRCLRGLHLLQRLREQLRCPWRRGSGRTRRASARRRSASGSGSPRSTS